MPSLSFASLCYANGELVFPFEVSLLQPQISHLLTLSPPVPPPELFKLGFLTLAWLSATGLGAGRCLLLPPSRCYQVQPVQLVVPQALRVPAFSFCFI